MTYESKAAIRKMTDDQYELIWNVNSSILSVMTEQQILDLIEALQRMATLPPGERSIYYFPVMVHEVTG